MFGIIEAIKQFFCAISSTFDFAKTNTEYAAEKDVLKSKKQLTRENKELRSLLIEGLGLMDEKINTGLLDKRRYKKYLKDVKEALKQ